MSARRDSRSDPGEAMEDRGPDHNNGLGVALPQGVPFPLARILTTARQYLGMDVVFLTRIQGGTEVFLLGDGDVRSFGPVTEGEALPLTETYCDKMVRDCLPKVVADARSNDLLSGLDITRSADIGSYVGIPIRLSDGSLYGTLCCLSHRAGARVGEDKLAVMHLLADMAGLEVSRQQESDRILVLQHRVARALQASPVGEDVLAEVVATICNVLGWERGSVWLGRTSPELTRRASWENSAPDPASPGAPRQPLDRFPVVRRAFESRALVQDTPTGPPAERPRPTVAVPIVASGTAPVGVLELHGPMTRRIDGALHTALLTVAAQVAEGLLAPDDIAGQETLTQRELEVLELCAAGSSVDDISRSVYLSPATVRTHLRNIYRKLGVPNRAGAVAQAMRRNLIT